MARTRVGRDYRRRGASHRRGRAGPYACHFTTGEVATLAVIGRQWNKAGRCDWPLDKIAAMAGVSASTAKRAIRHAEEIGLLRRQERRISRDRSLPSVLTIISPDWRSWLARGPKRGGVQKQAATGTTDINHQRSHARKRGATEYAGYEWPPEARSGAA